MVRVRHLLPPPLEMTLRIPNGWVRWEVGRYRERLTFGPGGRGRGKLWVPEKVGEQSNLILDQYYDSLIPNSAVGLLGASWGAVVGTSSAPPSPTTIGFTGTNRWTRDNPGGQPDQILNPSPGVYRVQRFKEFTEAQVGGLNLTEWGMTGGNANASEVLQRLMTRELFRDGNGNPIVLSLATDQRLRLIYEHEVQVGPTPAVPVSVNIAGLGTRTGQFALTNRFFVQGSSTPTAWGLLFPTGFAGGLLLPTLFAMGVAFISAGTGVTVYLDAFASSNAAPLSWNHTTNGLSGNTSPFMKALTYAAVSGRSRSASVVFAANEFNQTIRSVSLSVRDAAANRDTPTLNLVLDSGQEVTKTNTYRLTIANWQLTWGP